MPVHAKNNMSIEHKLKRFDINPSSKPSGPCSGMNEEQVTGEDPNELRAVFSLFGITKQVHWELNKYNILAKFPCSTMLLYAYFLSFFFFLMLIQNTESERNAKKCLD